MDDQFRRLREILRKNNPALSPSFQSLSNQLEEIAKKHRELFPSTALEKIVQAQNKFDLIDQSFLQSHKKLFQNIAIQDHYNFTGLLSASEEFQKIARRNTFAFDSLTQQLSDSIQKVNFRFTHSFQTVEKLFAQKELGIPPSVARELRSIGKTIISDLDEKQQIYEITKSVDKLANNYQEDSIKRYSLGEIIHNILFYISFILTVQNSISNADENILSNQEELLKQQQEIENKIESSLVTNEELFEKLYKIDPADIDSFKVTQDLLVIKEEPSDSSANKFELNANVIVKKTDQTDNYIRIKYFNFEKHEMIDGWIPKGSTISLEDYTEY